jgi:methionine-gamma-lyase
MKDASFTTRAIHSGESRDPTTRAHNTPIYQTATFIFDHAAELTGAYDNPFDTFFYSREGNPTVAKLQDKVSELTGGEACLATASGMAAISVAVMAVARCGDHILVSKDVFINSQQFFTIDCPDQGIEVSLVDILDSRAIEDAVRPNTKLIFAEIFVNPMMDLVDIKALRGVADRHQLVLIIDNTFLSPYLYRPIEAGADIVVHSATKYLSGHGDAVGGVLAGRKDLIRKAQGKFARFGQCMSPFNAWLILRGLRTLPLRLRQHSANALELANFLSEHPKVEWVRYPGLPSPSNSDLARSELTYGFGGVLLFKIPGGFGEMCQFMDTFKLAAIGTSLGDLFTLINPMTGADNSIRVSVGCEASEDIVADFTQALEHV